MKSTIELHKPIINTCLFLIGLGILWPVFFSQTKLVDSLTLVVGIIVYLFMPGYLLLINVKIDPDYRVAFSVPLSIVCVSLTIYFLDVLMSVPINFASVLLVCVFWSLLGVNLKLKGIWLG